MRNSIPRDKSSIEQHQLLQKAITDGLNSGISQRSMNELLKQAQSRLNVASYEETQETLALLKILALGNQEIEQGQVKPVADVVARLRGKRSAE